jgi:glutaredoxin
MNVIIAATKACRHCPMIKKELEKLGIDNSVHYFEDHPEIVERYNIKHSPLIIVDDEVIFNGMPTMSAMEKYFMSRKQNDSRPS